MAGNARDWTTTPGEGERDTRVVRGGAWYGMRINSRCAYRDLSAPANVVDVIGLRVVVPARKTRP